MQVLHKRITLAISAVAEIAGRPMPSLPSMYALAERFGVGMRCLDMLLRKLRRAGLIEGVRGRRGGYRLARPADQISALAIASAIQPAETDALPAPLGYACARFLADLDKVSVADLRERDLARLLESLAATLSFVAVLAALAGAWIATPAGML